ncbi:MAG: 23S rRNA (guanosine(2251)-2'-O)-methyltransferase RlmB [Selenomonadaceae bacterium]|nr:23S rRNA (guanosine(2251)-2'-O)-methyltransferase RlmB [Selenomonadaceae bacterium]MBQ6132365.1 23S rRNA (guanosine(2251)-2'-O)-methyltransferase RlmB [Selenomonadaceae bacterium]
MDDNLIFGRNAVIELLKSGHSVNKILIAEGSRDGSVQKIFALAKTAGVVVEFLNRDKLDKLCGGRHQGVAAYAAAADYSTVEEILELAANRKEPPFVILLDELEDPQNFGAILRTAEAVGVHGVIIPKRRSVQLNATVFKISAGAAEYVKVAQITNVAQTLKNLRGLGLKIVGSDMGAQVDFRRADLTGGIVLIIGSEGKGMRRLTRENCDLLIKIPMVGKINSLNASAAGAVLLYEIFSQRQRYG